VRHGARGKGDQQYPDSRGNPIDGAVKGWFVDFRRLRESRDLSHELQRGPLDLGFRGGRIEIVQGLDVSAHVKSPPQVLIYRSFARRAIAQSELASQIPHLMETSFRYSNECHDWAEKAEAYA
jgi:hypothetical protein